MAVSPLTPVLGVDWLPWIVGLCVLSVVVLVLIVVAPWKRVREEPRLDEEAETRLLLGEDPEEIDRDLAAARGRAAEPRSPSFRPQLRASRLGRVRARRRSRRTGAPEQAVSPPTVAVPWPHPPRADEPLELDVQHELVARDDDPAPPHLLDAAEERAACPRSARRRARRSRRPGRAPRAGSPPGARGCPGSGPPGTARRR